VKGNCGFSAEYVDIATIKFASDKHRYRSIRLKDYDYMRQGAYFVAIVTQKPNCKFGDIGRVSPCGCTVSK